MPGDMKHGADNKILAPEPSMAPQCPQGEKKPPYFL